MLSLFNIDSNYTEFLRLNADDRVNLNNNVNYKRVYCGIIVSSDGTDYFIPLTHKMNYSKKISELVFRVYLDKNGKKDELGMLLFNNAIPVKNGTYSIIPLSIKDDQTKEEKQYKALLQKQQMVLRKLEPVITHKFNKLKERQKLGKLSENELKRVCDYDKLELFSQIYDESLVLNKTLDNNQLGKLFSDYYKKQAKQKEFQQYVNQQTKMNQYLKKVKSGKIYIKKDETRKKKGYQKK